MWTQVITNELISSSLDIFKVNNITRQVCFKVYSYHIKSYTLYLSDSEIPGFSTLIYEHISSLTSKLFQYINITSVIYV